jgi:hypothetical protein
MHALLEILKGWLPVLTAVIGGLWGLITYLDNQRRTAEKESQTLLIQAQQPFLQKQLSLYFETSTIVGKLVTEDPHSESWKASDGRFWALYWSELAMVETRELEAAMKNFGDILRIYERSPDAGTKERLESAALAVAHAIRASVERGWGVRAVGAQP